MPGPSGRAFFEEKVLRRDDGEPSLDPTPEAALQAKVGKFNLIGPKTTLAMRSVIN